MLILAGLLFDEPTMRDGDADFNLASSWVALISRLLDGVDSAGIGATSRLCVLLRDATKVKLAANEQGHARLGAG